MIIKLHIQNDDRDAPILVCDELFNDVAEFFHCEQATVSTTYEQALRMAESLVAAVNS